jgi:S-layer protein
MPFTAAQITALYTTANVGVAPDAATAATIAALAAQSQAGALSDNAVLAFIINSGDNDTAVANLTYQFFLGFAPSAAGLSFLVNSATNPTDLNDAFYANFNQENRYVNFAANLGFGTGPGAAAFATTYGGLSSTAGTGATATSSAFVDLIYEQIVGTGFAQAAGIDANAAKAFIESGFTNGTYRNIAIARGMITASSPAATVDLATKVVAVGELLNESIKADVGIYAAAQNNFMLALINGTANPASVNLISTYANLGGGTGSAIGGTGATPGSITLDFTPNLDVLNGGAGNDVFIGDAFANANLNVVPADLANGNGGFDTFRFFQGASTVVPQLNSVENVQLVFSGAAYDVSAVAGVTTFTLEGAPTGSFTYTASPGTSFNITNGQNLLPISAAGVTSTFAAAGTVNTTLSGVGSYGGIVYSTATGLNLTSAANTPNSAGNTVTAVTANSATGVTITSLIGAPLAITTLSVTSATSLTVNANATTGLTTVTTGALATLNVNSNVTGVTTTIGAIALTAAGVANIAGAGNTTITTLTSGATINATQAGTLTVGATTVTALNGGTATGAIKATWAASAAATAITTGSGADVINLVANTGKHTVALGAGNDNLVLNAAAVAPAGSTYDGGADTDTLTLAQTVPTTAGTAVPIATITAANKGSFINFETLGTTITAGDVATFDLANLPTGITNVQVGTSTAGVVLNNAANNVVVNVVGSVNNTAGGATGGLTVNLAADTAADAATINLNPTTAAGLTIASLSVVDVETLNIASNTAAVATPNTITTLVGNPDLTLVNISGSGATKITTGALGNSTKFDASANTAGVNLNAAAATKATNMIGTAKNDTLTVSNVAGVGITEQVRGSGGGDAIVLGAGGAVDILVYTAGSDSLYDVVNAAGLGGTGTMDSVTGFVSGTDKVDLSVFAFTLAQQQLVDKGTVATTAALTALAGTSGFFQDNAGITRSVVQVDLAGDTYLFVDVNKDGVFQAGSDLAVKFVGVAQLQVTDLVGN